MLVDLVFGSLGVLIGLMLGCGWYSFIFLPAAFIIDLDLVVNEFFRIFIKKEKKFKFKNLLDEYSYTHKFWFHFPLITLPVIFVTGILCIDFLFGSILVGVVLIHLIHDTVDHNPDGVSWFWPFDKRVYKIRNGFIEIKTRKLLRKEADERRLKNPRSTKSILKDNSIT